MSVRPMERRGFAGNRHWATGGIFVVVVAVVAVGSADPSRQVVVATYNLWNIMFNWEIRKLRISQIVKEAAPDVIGLQEVRGYAQTGYSQIDDLKNLLPQYQHSHFEIAGRINPLNDFYKTGWELEGLGLLSRHPILKTSVYHLTAGGGPDHNRRILLHAVISVPNRGNINVIAVHFSYDRIQQCSNAAQLLQFIEENKLENVIVMGDFNTYSDFEWPILIVTGAATDLNNHCPQRYRQQRPGIGPSKALVDAWRILQPDKAGLTFSNMPTPGLESRPDRVLVWDQFQLTSAMLLGNGSVYRDRYFIHIWWKRFSDFLSSAWDGLHGYKGRSCLHDCGPHASCRCGICVAGKDDNACLIPDCAECTTLTLAMVAVAFVAIIGLVAQLIFAFLQVFLAMNRRSGDMGSLPFFSINCCLCNPRMYAMPTLNRWHRRARLAHIWPCLRLPPSFLVIVSVLLTFLWIELVLYLFSDALYDINAILPEEKYPSDHLMLVVHLQFP